MCLPSPGSVAFTPNTISWFLPKHIDPLISSGQFKLMEVHMGVNGERLDTAEMAARQYSLTVNDIYIIVEIPVGAVGGNFKVSCTELLLEQFLMMNEMLCLQPVPSTFICISKSENATSTKNTPSLYFKN